MRRAALRRAALGGATAAMVVAALLVAAPGPANADGPSLHAAGSTWVQIAMQQWTADVTRFGLSVDYQGIGSTAGRQNYMYNLIDFAATEIPYQPDELAEYHNELGSRFRTYQYLPDVAGGTSFMYNLNDPSTGRRITNLRLSSATIAKIFTGLVTSWHDPSIVADNPGVNIPNIPLIPVVRSDSSGTSGQLSLYLAASNPALWNPFASATGCPAPCSSWSTNHPFVGQSLSSGVTNYVASTPGSINYVEAGYALAKGFPVAYVRNASGNFTLPTSNNVATALTHARLYPDLTQDLRAVYVAPEANAYPVSSYSYIVAPTSNVSPDKGNVLGKFLLYVACAGQQEAPLLGYSPMPPNLVQVVFDAINRINGHPPTPDLSTAAGRAQCANPTIPQGGGGGGGNNGGGSGGGSGSATTGSTRSTTPGRSQRGSGSSSTIAPTTTTAKGAGSAPSGSILAGSGVFGAGDAPHAPTTPSERRFLLAAARRSAAARSLAGVQHHTDVALVLAAIYLPFLVYLPIFVRRRRANRPVEES
jgi:phosphate ABC transporter phosphate-binding protein